MNISKTGNGNRLGKVIQLTPAVCAEFIMDNKALSQIYITHLAHLPKAINHRRQFPDGMQHTIFLYCLSGSGWVSTGVRDYQLMPNQYILIPATDLSVSYGSEGSDPWGFYAVYFGGKDLNSFNQSFGVDQFSGPMDVGYNRKGIEIWDEMYYRLSRGISNLNLTYANLCLYHYLGSFLLSKQDNDHSDKDDCMDEIIAYMQQNIHEKLFVEDLARRLNFSVSHFSTLFKNATGLPPLEYFIQLKLQNACHLLKAKQLKVKEVADALGYEDPFHFSRIFKKHMKVSPLAYKAQCATTKMNVVSSKSPVGIRKVAMGSI